MSGEAIQPLGETIKLLQHASELPGLVQKSHDEINKLYQNSLSQDQTIKEYEEKSQEMMRQQTLMEQENVELRRNNDKLVKELSETRIRLSKVVSDRLLTNNAQICDLSDENRPTKIAEQYSELYDNQWTEAFEVLTKTISDERTVIEILRDIFIDCWTYCHDLSQSQLKGLWVALMSPVAILSEERSPQVNQAGAEPHTGVETHLPESILRYFQTNRKRCANESIKAEFEKYRMRLLSFATNDIQYKDQVLDFVKECFQVAYYMTIQDRPVVLDLQLGPGDTFDQYRFREYTHRGNTVDFIVWPCVLLHKDGPLLSKGIAQGRQSDHLAAGETRECQTPVETLNDQALATVTRHGDNAGDSKLDSAMTRQAVHSLEEDNLETDTTNSTTTSLDNTGSINESETLQGPSNGNGDLSSPDMSSREIGPGTDHQFMAVANHTRNTDSQVEGAKTEHKGKRKSGKKSSRNKNKNKPAGHV